MRVPFHASTLNRATMFGVSRVLRQFRKACTTGLRYMCPLLQAPSPADALLFPESDNREMPTRRIAISTMGEKEVRITRGAQVGRYNVLHENSV